MRGFDDGRLDPDTPLVLSGSAGRMRFAPEGLFGGRPGSPGRILVNDVAIAPTSSPEVVFRAGDVVRLLLPGGGGYGDPRRRARALIEADLRNGSITPEAARRDYGEEI
jgi:N-methylhydantoinase B